MISSQRKATDGVPASYFGDQLRLQLLLLLALPLRGVVVGGSLCLQRLQFIPGDPVPCSSNEVGLRLGHGELSGQGRGQHAAPATMET
jgi:hypothetical protein